ncbi:hypothetical protein DSM106972_097320 [Dulcicalothrix desertica PCC 7102]|uniref:Uncharacterized protein n=1 Tax=Dulcicalothrix desertica PCC 7102 TaxID=232991 RepID=A0A3S5K2Q9_9CYAN|nr:hypothetical protein [Dulcicalothrix desertica]RUS93138.1 hypothetical protein DSM106972_097320 [Dulcicalothrix desertica PCC 7102]TWH62789.1 hypothetical protein CAL7102_00317 [Dulcicalothrix desertica PCC 7102]
MVNFEQNRLEAIKYAVELNQKWDINRLIHNASLHCSAIESNNHLKDIRKLHRISKSDECLKETIQTATFYCGANNLLSALYFINGNYMQSDIWYARYIHAANRVLGQTNELNDMDK